MTSTMKTASVTALLVPDHPLGHTARAPSKVAAQAHIDGIVRHRRARPQLQNAHQIRAFAMLGACSPVRGAGAQTGQCQPGLLASSDHNEPWGTTHSCGAPPASARRTKSLS